MAQIPDRATLVNTLLFAAATVAAGTQPVLIGLYADRLQLSVKQSAWLASAEQVGMGLGAVAAVLLIPLWQARVLVWAAAAMALTACLAAAFATDYGTLLTSRLPFAAGMGLAYAVASYGLARGPDPARAFALAYSLQILLCAIYAYVVPHVREALGYGGAVMTLGVWLACLGIAAALLKASLGPPKTMARAYDLSWLRGMTPATWASLGAMVLFGMGICTLWSAAEPVARRMGADGPMLGLAISLGSFSGFVAGAAISLWSNRVGLVQGVVLTVSITFASLLWFALGEGATQYVLAMMVFNVGYTLGGVYFNAIAVTEDKTGGAARLLPAAHLAAGVLGGLAAGALSGLGLAYVTAAAMVFCLASAAALLLRGRVNESQALMAE